MRPAALLLSSVLAAAALGLGASVAEEPVGIAVWEQLPTEAQIFEAILSHPPCGPDGTYTDGMAMVECVLGDDGRLNQCKVVRESPEGCSFGKIALAASKHFKAAGTLPDGKPLKPGTRMFVPMAFKAPPPDMLPPTTAAMH